MTINIFAFNGELSKKVTVVFIFLSGIVQSLSFLNQKFQAYSHLLWLYKLFVSDLVGNPQDRFSHEAARNLIRVDIC